MAGFTTVDSVINAMSYAAHGEVVWFSARPLANTANTQFSTTWNGTGAGAGGGTLPTAGTGSATACTSSTAGALKFTDPSGGRTKHLVSFGAATSEGSGGVLLMVDRLAHATIAANATSPIDWDPDIDAWQSGSGRLASGEGAMIVVEISSQLSTTANSYTFSYTNESGTASRTSGAITTVSSSSNYAAGKLAYTSLLFAPLQSGDRGVRSIQSMTRTSGSAQTGELCVALVKPIAMLHLPTTSCWVEKDFVTEIPALPEIKAGSCLSFYLLTFSAVSTGAAITACVRMAEN